MTETHAQAVRSNDGRPTCAACHCPMRYNRHSTLCPSCNRDDTFQYTLKKKETVYGQVHS